ncbi:hypothetical protein MBAV_002778 [Candidatus Magnetobacterium bavaricum]|uniref:Uncharacterized protein n=1 Tax=Candidatus Magnetobacterium bavaricum TaxID=29290 RepID=A0A0F3GT65_9BACT|nr:hypothetical protein MBAV_002778 [Candidatus Magnetobacterium bavaricum]
MLHNLQIGCIRKSLVAASKKRMVYSLYFMVRERRRAMAPFMAGAGTKKPP